MTRHRGHDLDGVPEPPQLSNQGRQADLGRPDLRVEILREYQEAHRPFATRRPDAGHTPDSGRFSKIRILMSVYLAGNGINRSSSGFAIRRSTALATSRRREPPPSPPRPASAVTSARPLRSSRP